MTNNVATRSELLARRARIALAGQGRDLLTEKRTALVAELRALGAEVLSGLDELQQLAAAAAAALAEAEAAEPGAVRSAGRPAGRDLPARITTRTVAGVTTARIGADPVRRARAQRGLSLVSSSPRVDRVAERYEELVDRLLAVAALELSIRRLGKEIARTTRQVNGLENVMIPRLEAERDSIAQVLEGRELEERARLRRARARQAPRRSAAPSSSSSAVTTKPGLAPQP